MKRVRLLFVVVVTLSTSVVQAMSLEEIEKRFTEEVEKTKQEKVEKQTELKGMYLKALLRYESRTKQDGDLEGLQTCRAEIHRVEQMNGLTPAPQEGPEDFKTMTRVVNEKLREINRETAEEIRSMVDSVAAFAEAKAVEFTREGDVREAVKWRDWGLGLRDRPGVATFISFTNRPSASDAASEKTQKNQHDLFGNPPSEIITVKSTGFPFIPTLYAAGSEPDGDEKRISSHTPSAQGAGHTLLQGRITLIEEENLLRRVDGIGYDYKHKELLFVARMEFTTLPGKSLEPSLLVFDLFKRGTGSKRAVIRTEGLVLPPMAPGDRWVVDSGSYTYETRESDWSHSNWDSKSATADEFYGYIVSIFDQEGTLIFQRTSERMLGDFARESPPAEFDEPQSESDTKTFQPR